MQQDLEEPLPSGFIPNPFDPRDLWEDELLAGDQRELPTSYEIDGLLFEPQGSWPFCVSFATTTMVEYWVKEKNKKKITLSQPHLFFHSGGSRGGSWFRANLQTAKDKGMIPFGDFTLPENIWDVSDFDHVKDEAINTPFKNEQKILGYVRIRTDRDALKRSIKDYGPVLTGVAASGGYWKDNTTRSKQEDNHAVLLVGWDEHDNWIVFDSLQPKTGFNGYHRLHRTYTFNSAYVVTDIPKDHKKMVKEKREDPYQHCLNHYGKPRDFEEELVAAEQLRKEFKKFKNQSVWEAAGRFWPVLINMAAYGDYSISYRKWGRWMPGDLINLVYYWRRTGQMLFDPNKLRSEVN